MNEFSVFMYPQSLFGVLGEFIGENESRLVLRRFKGGAFESESAGLEVIASEVVGPDLANDYVERGYSQIYISFGGLPSHERHWAFIEANSARLIELSGFRYRENELELGVVRLLSKTSKVRKEFKDLCERLGGLCLSDVVLTYGGTEYPEVRCSVESVDAKLVQEIGKEQHPDWVCS
jgi:hypothetical protein